MLRDLEEEHEAEVGSCLWGAQGHCGAADEAGGSSCQVWHCVCPPESTVWAELSGELLCSALLQQQTTNPVPLPSAQPWEVREIPLNVPSASNALGQGSIALKADCAPSQEAAPQCSHPNSILLLLLSGCLEVCGQSVLLHLLLVWQDVKYSAA